MTYGLMLVMHLGSSGREKENLICPGSPVNGLKANVASQSLARARRISEASSGSSSEPAVLSP